MKKYIFAVFIALLSLPVIAQQQLRAKIVFDKTTEAFQKANGIKADFMLKVITNGHLQGSENGTIMLNGDKFMLKTSEMTTWFDGKTQWSYITRNDEVNVSNPTSDELQQINPYSFLYIGKRNYNYQLGSTNVFQGKPIWEVILTSKNKKVEFDHIVLYVTKNTYEPLYIKLRQRGQNTFNEITVTHYQKGLQYANSTFVFNKKNYQTAEIIDLR